MRNKNWLLSVLLVGLLSSIPFVRPALAETVTKAAEGLSAPVGMVFDRDGYLYIANWSGGRIDRWRSDGELEVYLSGISSPSGLALDQMGRLYVATYSGGKILRFTKDKKQEVFVSGLSVVAGLNFDLNGNLLVAERGKSRVLRVSPQGKIEVLVDKGMQTPVAAVQLSESIYVINDITGRVYAYDAKNDRLRTLSDKLKSPAVGLAQDPAVREAVLTVDYGATGVYRISLSGEATVITSKLSSPVGLAIDSAGNVYAATWSDNALYQITP